jgi:hypothetical protein
VSLNSGHESSRRRLKPTALPILERLRRLPKLQQLAGQFRQMRLDLKRRDAKELSSSVDGIHPNACEPDVQGGLDTDRVGREEQRMHVEVERHGCILVREFGPKGSNHVPRNSFTTGRAFNSAICARSVSRSASSLAIRARNGSVAILIPSATMSATPGSAPPTAPRTAAARDPTRDVVPHSCRGPIARPAQVGRRGRGFEGPTAIAGPRVRCPTDRSPGPTPTSPAPAPRSRLHPSGTGANLHRRQGRQRMHMRRSRPVPIDSKCPAENVLRYRFAGSSRPGPCPASLTHRKASRTENV